MKTKSPQRSRDRHAWLTARRNKKMARSPHAYMRGNTTKFYEWLDDGLGLGVGVGPPIWICGDCHFGNLGPVADAKGNVALQIRDLDQAVIGNPSHDLIRLALSLATIARSSSLPGITTARMFEALTQGYVKGLLSREAVDSATVPTIHGLVKQAIHRRCGDLLKERIENKEPSIPRGKRFWSLSRTDAHDLDTLVSSSDIADVVRSLVARSNDASVKVADAAFWVKGCSSLGLTRYAALLTIGNGKVGENGLCLLDLKEATRSCAPVVARASMPRDHGRRVVTAARALSPSLGDRMTSGALGTRSMFMRELLPQDLKIDIQKLSMDEATAAAGLLASVVGEAHGRQMEPKLAREWARTLRASERKSLAAPSWLWTTVVGLLGLHETEYLAHCRAYAKQQTRYHGEP